MSLIGIDVGSTSVKVAAYSEEGKLLGLASNLMMPQPLRPVGGSRTARRYGE